MSEMLKLLISTLCASPFSGHVIPVHLKAMVVDVQNHTKLRFVYVLFWTDGILYQFLHLIPLKLIRYRGWSFG